MHNPLASGHELEVTGMDGALATGKVLMVYRSGKQVCDGFLTSAEGVSGLLPSMQNTGYHTCEDDPGTLHQRRW